MSLNLTYARTRTHIMCINAYSVLYIHIHTVFHQLYGFGLCGLYLNHKVYYLMMFVVANNFLVCLSCRVAAIAGQLL